MRAVLRGLGAVPVARKDRCRRQARRRRRVPRARCGAERASAQRRRVRRDVRGARATAARSASFPRASRTTNRSSRSSRPARRDSRSAVRRTIQVPITIVPCGLTFIHPKRFRSRVLVQYGPPIVIEPGSTTRSRRRSSASPTRSRRRAPPPHDQRARLGDRARARRRAPALPAARDLDRGSRRAVATIQHVLRAQSPRIRRSSTLMARVRAYQQKLDELGLTDRELARDLSQARDQSRRMLRHLILVAFWLPLTVPGAPLHVPTVAFARIAGPRLTPRKDVVATTKMLIGMLLVLLSYAIAVAVLWWKRRAVGGRSPPRSSCRSRAGRRCACSIGCGSCAARFGALVRRLAIPPRGRSAARGARRCSSADVIRVVTEVKPADLDAAVPAGSSGSRRCRGVRGARRERRSRRGVRQGRRRGRAEDDDEAARRAAPRPRARAWLDGTARRGTCARTASTRWAARIRRGGTRSATSRASSRTGIVEHAGDRPVCAVTHSMGGVIVRHLHDPRIHWQRIVMLAPPNRGSQLAAGLDRATRCSAGTTVPRAPSSRMARSWPAPPAPFARDRGDPQPRARRT